MSVTEKFNRWFRTEAFRRQECAKWARFHFQGTNEEIAEAVAYTLVETLGINLSQLTPRTDIVADLAANEWTEWAEIQSCLEEELSCYFAAEPEFLGRTIADLVDFVAKFKLPVPRSKTKRGILSPTGWCFAASPKPSPVNED